ncbi:MAG: hypothetical protein AABX08_02080 [Nanoarchaeota archaeon]
MAHYTIDKQLTILFIFILLVGYSYYYNLDLIGITGRAVSIGEDACQDDTRKIVYRMSDTENAHAAFSATQNDEIYNVKVCWDDAIFFDRACRDANDRPIDPADESAQPVNAILRISATSPDGDNAHAEEWNRQAGLTDGYEFLCYSNLRCGYVPNTGAGDDCQTFDPQAECFGTLSGDTNAHVADCTADSSIYTRKICCKPGCVITDSHWTDLSGRGINTVGNGAIVNMKMFGTSECSGLATYKLYEDDPVFDDLVATFTGTYPIQQWRAHWTYDGDDDMGNDPRDYYFVVTFNGRDFISKDLNQEFGILSVSREDEPDVCGDDDIDTGEVCDVGPDGTSGTNDDVLPGNKYLCSDHNRQGNEWRGDPAQGQRLFCGSNCLIIDTSTCICETCT